MEGRLGMSDDVSWNIPANEGNHTMDIVNLDEIDYGEDPEALFKQAIEKDLRRTRFDREVDLLLEYESKAAKLSGFEP